MLLDQRFQELCSIIMFPEELVVKQKNIFIFANKIKDPQSKHVWLERFFTLSCWPPAASGPSVGLKHLKGQMVFL